MNYSYKIQKGIVLKYDPYVLSSQANQVFYVEDEKDIGWIHVMRVKLGDNYQLGSTMTEDDDDELYQQCVPSNISREDEFRDPTNWANVDSEE